MGITTSVAKQDHNLTFEERFKYFLAKNKRNKQFIIHAIGTSGTMEEYRAEEDDDDNDDYLDGRLRRQQQQRQQQQQQKALMWLDQNKNHYDYTDSGFQSSDTEIVSLVDRPANPLSSILNGDRRRQQRSNSSSSFSSMSTFLSLATSTTSSASTPPEPDLICQTDTNGIFFGRFDLPVPQVLAWAKHQDLCDARLLRIHAGHPDFPPAHGMVHLIEPTGISVISDIDDTIKHTNILNGTRVVLANTFFRATKAVAGMAEAYMKWFLRDHGFPSGSMHLRMEGSLLARLIEVPGRAKRDAILQILRDFPARRFVLIGDSGEIDLEIYARIACEHPHQILKIFIRDVSSRPVRKTTPIWFAARRSSSYSSPGTATKTNTNPRHSQLLERLAKARKLAPHVNIVLFHNADELKNDTMIQDALWKNWDDHV
ncbi:hypothetical protein EC973_001245 [Apophysomyces ossiformis]|uniref:Phosphatidate phosphatase APP1 catalytic domain-containing protein n=1 Tax=Apophysomyces ossiformis TaxID=679940 RepID=A0A8H7ENN4_9FUNG|nr:hypothetical protein EC973_001245 [Apophysomyces ossiformis]